MELLTLVTLGVVALVVALLIARQFASPAPPQTALLKPSIFRPTPEMKINARTPTQIIYVFNYFSTTFLSKLS
jgi:hypothetical protein